MEFEQILNDLTIHSRVDISRASNDIRKRLGQCGLALSGAEVRLPNDVKLLHASAIRQSLSESSDRWITDLEIHSVIESTNTELVHRGQKISIDGHVIATEMQTEGRGRRGRSWIGAFGRNIALSIGMRLARPPTSVGSVSLVVGLAVVEAIENACDVKVMLKWPNDVLLDGRKIAGILIELTRAVKPVEIVIGVGLNVGESPEIATSGALPSASLAEYSANVDRNPLLARLIDQIVSHCREFEKSGFAVFRDRWVARDSFMDKSVSVDGDTKLEGVAQGVANDGALLVKTAEGTVRVIGGDVTVRRGVR